MAFTPISVTHTTVVMHRDADVEPVLCVEHFEPIDGKMRLVSRNRRFGRRPLRSRRAHHTHDLNDDVVVILKMTE